MNANDHFTLIPQTPREFIVQWAVVTWLVIAACIGTVVMLAEICDGIAALYRWIP